MRLAAGLRTDPLEELDAIKGGLLLREGEGRGGKGKGWEGMEKEGEGKGGKGKGRGEDREGERKGKGKEDLHSTLFLGPVVTYEPETLILLQ